MVKRSYADSPFFPAPFFFFVYFWFKVVRGLGRCRPHSNFFKKRLKASQITLDVTLTPTLTALIVSYTASQLALTILNILLQFQVHSTRLGVFCSKTYHIYLLFTDITHGRPENVFRSGRPQSKYRAPTVQVNLLWRFEVFCFSSKCVRRSQVCCI